MKRTLFSAFMACLAGVASTADSHADRVELAQARDAKAAGTSASGVIRKIDRGNSRVTIEHNPIPSIGMPGMTMAFKVTDPKLLEKVRQGDEVIFEIKQSGLGWIVTSLDRK